MSLFFLPGAKYAQKVDVNTALYESIAASRGEAAASSVSSACRAFQELRAAVNDPPYADVNRRQLKSYLAALQFLLNEANISPNLPVNLLWVSAFDSEEQCSLSDVRIDNLAVLFNLGVCEAHLANSVFRQRRANPNAMKTATHHFRNAAGYFQAAGDLPIPGGFHAATRDLYPATLKALEMAMLGNAQQALYEIALEGGNSPSVLARFAIGARDFYAIAEESCREPDVVNTTINAYVGRPAGALAAYFDVIAEWSMTTAARDEHDMGQQLKRISLAEHSLQVSSRTVQQLQNSGALASVNTLRESLTLELEDFRTRIAARKSEAEQENRTIYFTTPALQVQQIVPRQSVRPTDVQTALRDESVDQRLLALKDLPEPVTPEVSGIASRYSDMVAKTVADTVTSVNEAADDLRGKILQIEATISSWQTLVDANGRKPSAVQASSLEEDQKAIDAVLKAQDRGGIDALIERQSQLLSLAGEAKSQTQSIETLLRTEEAEDRQLRQRVSFHRRTSVELTEPYWSTMTKIKRNLEVASNSDTKAAAEIEYHSAAITAIRNVKVLDFVPPSAKPKTDLASTRQAHVAALSSQSTSLTEKGKRLLAEKDDLIQEFERMRQLENPYKLTRGVAEDGSEVDSLSSLVEERYGSLQVKTQKLSEEMRGIAEGIAETSSQFQLPDQNNDTTEEDQARMNEIYRHQAAAQKFDEVMDHLRQGAEFYCREQDCISMLKRDVEGYVAARRQEAIEVANNDRMGGYGATGYPSAPGIYPPNQGSYSSNGHPYPRSSATNNSHSASPSIWRRQ